jgi:tRNA/tmRNA/rRNA uracil-C5-methylase (TrmA/RlmC/RlmD family)
LRDIDGCKVEFLEFKGKVQAMKKELIDDYKGWETKRDRLITECENIEKKFDIRVKAACETLDKTKAETTEARNELKQLRASVGPKGTVTDLVKQKEDLKTQLADKDQQLAEKALWLSRDFNARMEAERTVTEERENTLALAEHLIKKTGDLPHLFLFLVNPKTFPEGHFKELNSLMDELEVWRGYEKPPSLYKDILSKSKVPLKHIKADIEKYME